MAEVHLTKQATAQRQIDAAIRILFSGEDPLAVHTVVFAAHTVLSDLDQKNSGKSQARYAEVLAEMQKSFPGALAITTNKGFKYWLQSKNRTGANFLKHADKDSGHFLDPSTLSTDHLLLEACTIYMDLGLEPTREMSIFGRWHLAVYPNCAEDRIRTESGDLAGLPREQQLDFGLYFLSAIEN